MVGAAAPAAPHAGHGRAGGGGRADHHRRRCRVGAAGGGRPPPPRGRCRGGTVAAAAWASPAVAAAAAASLASVWGGRTPGRWGGTERAHRPTEAGGRREEGEDPALEAERGGVDGWVGGGDGAAADVRQGGK